MPGNSKNKRKSGGAKRFQTVTVRGALPIIFRNSHEDTRTLKLMPHTELAAIREGKGNEDSYWTIVDRLNWASTLASMVQFSEPPGPTINAALDAMMALHARFKQHGRFVFAGDELKAVGDGLTLADDMHDATSRRQHRDAFVRLISDTNRLRRAA